MNALKIHHLDLLYEFWRDGREIFERKNQGAGRYYSQRFLDKVTHVFQRILTLPNHIRLQVVTRNRRDVLCKRCTRIHGKQICVTYGVPERPCDSELMKKTRLPVEEPLTMAQIKQYFAEYSQDTG